MSTIEYGKENEQAIATCMNKLQLHVWTILYGQNCMDNFHKLIRQKIQQEKEYKVYFIT